jgi:hypothetical protein
VNIEIDAFVLLDASDDALELAAGRTFFTLKKLF